MEFYHSLPNQTKGVILIATGALLILYTLGLIQKGINYAIMAGAAYLIYRGIEKLGGFDAIMGLIKKN